MIRWVSDCEELLAEETGETRRVIREHEAAGFTGCPEYQAAILGFYRKHVCRLDPWPAGPGALLRRSRRTGRVSWRPLPALAGWRQDGEPVRPQVGDQQAFSVPPYVFGY
jgi:hypothetical protein